ncbi:type VI secretion system membrane subunit TssM [Pantoea dispersa]|uniref:type VI secretion system membrane subunit TssM n=1 Tax=Pantoea dispersa TaxID=59814 RepID=UPI0021AEFFCA|nr:type VI secretion system membrane subunit TssM [Pantoea dispersa]MCT6588468.1 type VI secretion system membrane subunit TssM [Pantoea dispersa]
MSVLNRIFSGTGLRRFALIACFAVLAAAVWFLGPWFGFGEVTPWASVESRVIMLVLLLVMLLLRWYRLPLFVDVALLVMALVWIIGPHIMVGERYPLKSPAHRWTVIALLLVVTALWGLWRLLQALAVNPELLNKFRSQRVTSGNKPDLRAINQTIAAGVKYTQRIHRALPLWRRFFSFTDSKNRLPWFMVLGSEGAGKTTMLFSSGLDFPLPDQLNRQGRENPPTENIECLYTNEALFLDTAGKYLLDTPQARQEWQGVLAALKKYRPQRSISGVVVALSVADILHRNQAERLAIAAALRARLSEAREKLGLRFPVYVNITHMDMLTGFSAYFRDLTAAEREQVLGVTLPFDRQSPVSAAELGNDILNALSKLEARLSSALCQRQLEEYDVTDRKQMYALPQDFRLLAHSVAEMLQHLFLSSRYDETQFNTTLRGIYFISSCQPDDKGLLNNNTVVQRWRNVVNNQSPDTPTSYSIKREEAGVINAAAWGKHYFLRQLFTEVISADGDLVRSSLRMRTRDRLQNLAGHLAAVLLTIWLVWGIVTSFQLNRDYLATLAVRTTQLTEKVEDYVTHPEQQLLPGVLYSTQALDQYLGLDIDNPPLNWRYGLYTPGTIDRRADKLYTFFLQNALLPKLQDQAATTLSHAIAENDTGATWDALKLYLMLKGEGDSDRTFLLAQINQQWKASGKIEAYGEQSTFDSHLNALFSSRGWQEKARQLDPVLVKRARDLLAQSPQTTRIWQHFKQKMMAEAPPNVTLQAMVDPQAPMIFKLMPPADDQDGVPGLFTRDGWRNLVKKQLATSLVGLQREDSWVLGKPAVVVNPLTLRDEVLTLYLQEYSQHWQRFLSAIRLIPMSGQQNLTLDVALLRTLVADNSPLRSLLERAVMETTLAESRDKALQDALQHEIRTGRLVQQATRVKQGIDFREQRLVNQYVDFPFSSLRRFVGGEQSSGGVNPNQTVGLNRLMNLLTDQYTRYVVYNSALDEGDIPVMGPDSARLAAESRTWPEPVKGILMPLLGRSNETIRKSIVKLSVTAIDNGIGQMCRNTLQGRYPFAPGRQEVSLAEFERFFATDGVVDGWFKQHLADKVDTSTSPWRYKGSEGGQGLDFFEQAAAIRDAFFDASGRRVSINLTTQVHYLSPAISQLTLNIGEETLRYSHGPVITQALHWPAGGLHSSVRMTGQRLPSSAMPDLTFGGAWSVLRWLDSAKRVSASQRGEGQIYQWSLGGKPVELEIAGLGNGKHTLQEILRGMRCPG